MRKFALIFPGQGSQFLGMCKGIYDEFSIARETFEEASDTLNLNLADLCFKGPVTDLMKTENSHLAIVTSSVALFRVFMDEVGETPQFCAGHSLGEYSALACAGALSFGDTLKIVRFRAKLAEHAGRITNGGMSIVDNLESSIVYDECKKMQYKGKKVYVSCYNGMFQTAISGYIDDIFCLEEIFLDKGAQVTPLIGSAPYHCPLMNEVTEVFENHLKEFNFQKIRYPVISNVDTNLYNEENIIRNLKKHLISPVKWTDIISCLNKELNFIAIEMSPKDVLANIINLNSKSMKAICYGQIEQRKNLINLFDVFGGN